MLGETRLMLVEKEFLKAELVVFSNAKDYR
jgi:hypothetical protein